jgi:HlyD family secretion protein
VNDLSSDLASLKIQREDPNRPRPMRAVVYAVLAVGAAAGAGVLGYPALEAKVFKTEVKLTEISVVSPVQASVTVTSTGYVVPQTISKVGAKVAGRIARVRVKEGDVVKAGDVLAEIDATDQRSTIAAAGSKAAAAQARVETARASLAEVVLQVKRNKALVEKGALAPATQQDLEARQHSLEEQVRAAEAEARAAQAEITPMKVGLDDRTIVAPIGGTVITKPVEVGELVGPTVQITEIADFASLMVETDVPEARLYQIKPGTPCEIVLDAYPGKRYRGAAVEIGKRVDRAKATLKVKVKFTDAAEGVLPDMSARTSFLTQEISDQALREAPKRVVPANAVAERNGQKIVFVADGDAVRATPVKVGVPVGSGLELVDGPTPGTRVVADPPRELADGQRIKEKGG